MTGTGSTFYIELPTGERHENVLIVDDEKNIRETLADILTDEGYTALTVESGPQAIAILDTRRVELILLDIWLADMGGMEVLERIRKEYPNVMVVMISGHATVDLAVQAIKMGAVDFIEKPLSLDRCCRCWKRPSASVIWKTRTNRCVGMPAAASIWSGKVRFCCRSAKSSAPWPPRRAVC